jgi:hypothetical protein
LDCTSAAALLAKLKVLLLVVVGALPKAREGAEVPPKREAADEAAPNAVAVVEPNRPPPAAGAALPKPKAEGAGAAAAAARRGPGVWLQGAREAIQEADDTAGPPIARGMPLCRGGRRKHLPAGADAKLKPGVEPAPKAGAEAAPNPNEDDDAGAPNAGAEAAAPKAGAGDAPNAAGALCAPNAKPVVPAAAPNGDAMAGQRSRAVNYWVGSRMGGKQLSTEPAAR